jgi:hypothetical protein
MGDTEDHPTGGEIGHDFAALLFLGGGNGQGDGQKRRASQRQKAGARLGRFAIQKRCSARGFRGLHGFTIPAAKNDHF